MFLSLINLLPLFFTFSAAFGVLIHDTQTDRAMSTVIAAPVEAINYGSADDLTFKLSDQHVHTETINVAQNIRQLGSNQPRIQPRMEEKKYIVQKKLVSNSAGNDYHWPSI